MPNETIESSYYDEATYPESRPRDPSSGPLLNLALAGLKRPWLVVISTFMLFVPVLFYLFSQVPVYRSSSIVSTSVSSPRSLIMQDLPIGSSGAEEEYYTSILQSTTFKRSVAQKIANLNPWLDRDSLSSVISSGAISFERKTRSAQGFLNISATSQTPEFAELICSQALASFQEISTELRRSDQASVVKFIESQLVQLGDQLGATENEIQNFLRDRGLNLSDVAAGIDGELRTLEKSLADAEASLELARMQIESYSSQLSVRLDDYLKGSEVGQSEVQVEALRQRFRDLERALSQAIDVRDSTEVQQLQEERRQILAEMTGTLTRVQGAEVVERTKQVSLSALGASLDKWLLDYETAQTRRDYFDQAIMRFLQAHPNMSGDILEYLNMTRSKNVMQKTIDILVEQREQLRIKMASESGGVKIIDPPVRPTSPVNQKRGMKLLASFFFALFIGVMLSYAVDLFDNTIQGEKDMQNRFGLPVYGSVPVLSAGSAFSRRKRSPRSRDENPNLNGQHKITHLDFYSESSPVAEAYRSIKTAILFSARDRSRKTFIISSPVSGDGKSLTSYNLAVSFAQGGTRTLLVDADLRRASQHKLLGVERGPGLADLLLGTSSMDAIVRQHPNLNSLSIITAGQKVGNPAELLSSNTMKSVMSEFESRFDLILIDTPPITPCMDSRHLALMVGGMILVVRAESTKLNVIEHSLSLCKRIDAEIIGVIVNHATFRYGYGYYYIYQRHNPYGYYYSGYQYYYSQDSETGEKVRKKKRTRTRKGASYEVSD